VEIFCGWLASHGTSCLEFIAVLFGIVGVYLSIRESVWNWPIGMVNVALYSLLFVRQRLYANAVLQVVYFVLSAYGWYEWLYGGKEHAPLNIARAGRRTWAAVAVAGVLSWIVIGLVTRLFAGAMPWFDAGTVAASLVAEWMLARKLIDNWVLWILVDAAYLPLLLLDHLYFTAINYAVYFALAVLGFVAWKRLLAVNVPSVA
jgi:nicotinamide mononucleotide transporter